MTRLLISLLLSVASFAQSGGQPINIPIQNPDFTQGETGWTFSSGSGVTIFNGIPMAGIGYGSSFSQTIAVPQMPVGVYTLTASTQNFFYWYPGEPIMSISLSGAYESPWCSTSWHPLGDLMQFVLVCPARDMYAQNLTISFYDKGWPAEFTHVSLAFTLAN